MQKTLGKDKLNFFLSVLFRMKIRVLNILIYCLWKQFFASNLSQISSNLICLKLLVTLRPLPVDNETSNGRPFEVRFKSSFVKNGRPANVSKMYQMIPNMSVFIEPIPDVQQRRNMDVKKTSQRDMYLQTDAFLTFPVRPLRCYMDFILFILWKYSRRAFDLCESSNEPLEAFNYIKQRKLGIQLNL